LRSGGSRQRTWIIGARRRWLLVSAFNGALEPRDEFSVHLLKPLTWPGAMLLVAGFWIADRGKMT
jgi:hypothetical protein